jgi:hypothetical protein
MPFLFDSNKTTGLEVEQSALRSPFPDLGLQSELAGIAEIAVSKPIQKAKTGDPSKARRAGRDPNSAQITIKTHTGNLHAEHVDWKRTHVGAAEDHRLGWNPTTHKAIILIQ